MSKETRRELAIIRTARFGIDGDHALIGLWLTVAMLNGAADLYLPQDVWAGVLHDTMVDDVKKLERRPCEVEIEGSGMATVRFVRMLLP